MTDLWTERLSEYLDGDLAPAEREDCERHLGTCAECTRTLESLQAVVVRARSITDVPLERDLWPGIEARIGAPAAAPVPARRRVLRLPSLSERFSFTLPQAAAAALLLVALSAGGAWIALRGAGPAPQGAPAGRTPIAQREPTGSAPADEASGASGPRVDHGAPEAALAGFDPSRYDAAVADLERALRDHRAELDTSTVRVLEQNLRTIDRAIAQARSALAADPASPYLNGHLARQMLLKIDLLRRATAFHGAQG